MVAKYRKITRIPRRMVWAFVLESVETKQMLFTFAKKGRQRLLTGDPAKGPSEEEMQQALEQLKDIPRFLPFFVFIVMPAPGVTEGYVLLAMTLERWMGKKVSLLPSQFRQIFKKNDD
jgi:hypothetical protein